MIPARDSSVARFRRKRGWAWGAHGLSVSSPLGLSRAGYARFTDEAAYGESSLQRRSLSAALTVRLQDLESSIRIKKHVFCLLDEEIA